MTISKEYLKFKDKPLNEYPYVTITVVIDGNELKPFDALADTGYDGSILISKSIANKLSIPDDRRRTDDPVYVIAADNRKIPVHAYEVDIKINNEIISTYLKIPVEDVDFLHTAFVGRQIMDSYDFLFNGRSDPKKLVIN